MARFRGEYAERFVVDVPLARAVAHFGDLDRIMACYPDVERFEVVDDLTRDIVLVRKGAMGVYYQARYRVRWSFPSDDVIRWETIGDGNADSSGRCRFSPEGADRTRVDYLYQMECEIPVSRLFARTVNPIVRKDIVDGAKRYLERMRARLSWE